MIKQIRQFMAKNDGFRAMFYRTIPLQIALIQVSSSVLIFFHFPEAHGRKLLINLIISLASGYCITGIYAFVGDAILGNKRCGSCAS